MIVLKLFYDEVFTKYFKIVFNVVLFYYFSPLFFFINMDRGSGIKKQKLIDFWISFYKWLIIVMGDYNEKEYE